MKKAKIVLILLIMLAAGTQPALADYENEGVELTVKVIEAEDYTIESDDACSFTSGQKVTIKILDGGVYYGREYKLDNTFENDYYRQAKHLKEGDVIEVILYFSEEGRVDDFYIYSRVIYYHAIWLIVLFFVVLILVGRKKGLKSAISLGLTLGIVIFVMIPLLKRGYSPVPVTILSSLVVTVVTLTIVGGFTVKSLSAILGTVAGLLVAWALSAVVANMGNMTAIATEEVEMLMYNNSDITYNLKGILLSGIIIGCLGAVMDVAMSISSAVNQVKMANPDLGKYDLFVSGMDVGCDIIGTMANTLILAYTGSALTMILVQSTYGFSISDMLNHDFILEEVLRSLAGSIGMILAVPFTALIASQTAKLKPRAHAEE